MEEFVVVGKGVEVVEAFCGPLARVEHESVGTVGGEVEDRICSDENALKSPVEYPVGVFALGEALDSEGAETVAFPTAKVLVVEFVSHAKGFVDVVDASSVECYDATPIGLDAGIFFVRS